MAETKEKLKHKYIFPDFLAKAMAKVDLRTQYEASMLSSTLMMGGLILTITYLVIYFDLALWYKIVLVINGLSGLVFFMSSLTTIFQQYRSYMDATQFQRENFTNSQPNKNSLLKGGKKIDA